jgi:hypothetical protein
VPDSALSRRWWRTRWRRGGLFSPCWWPPRCGGAGTTQAPPSLLRRIPVIAGSASLSSQLVILPRPALSHWDMAGELRSCDLHVVGHGEKASWGVSCSGLLALGGSRLVYFGCCNNVFSMLQLVVFMFQSFVVHVAIVEHVISSFLTCCERSM